MAETTSAPGRERQFHMPHPHLPHGLVAFPNRYRPWIEPWFFAYACLGVVQGGMLPLLLPLSSGGSLEAEIDRADERVVEGVERTGDGGKNSCDDERSKTIEPDAVTEGFHAGGALLNSAQSISEA